MSIFLLSGLSCCLGFSGVCCFAVWARARFIFFLCGRGRGARPNSNNKKTRPQNCILSKKHPPAQTALFGPGAYFCCLGGWACVFCLLFGRVGGFFVFPAWAGAVFFAVWAGRFFFLLFGRWLFLFLLFGRVCVFVFCCMSGCVCFLLFGRGTGVHSLTGLPGSSSRGPTKKTKQQKKKKNIGSLEVGVRIYLQGRTFRVHVLAALVIAAQEPMALYREHCCILKPWHIPYPKLLPQILLPSPSPQPR